MDFTQALTLVGSYGFPIIACIWMAAVGNKTIQRNTEVMQKLVERWDHYHGKT